MNRRGFTLVEIILAMAVASGIAVAAFSAFQLIDSVRQRQRGAGLVAWEGDLIVARVGDLIERGVSMPGPQETSAFLVLADGTTVEESDGTLTMTVGGDPVDISSPDVRVSSLSFSDAGDEQHPGIITVDFTLSTAATSSRMFSQRAYHSTFYAH